MKIYIDLYLIFNFIMDMIITISVSILLKRKTSPLRIILSSLLGVISSLVLFTSLNKILIEIISVILMSLISFGYKNIRYLLKNILYMYLLSTLLGGVFYLFELKVTTNIFVKYLLMLIISVEVLTLYLKENKKIKNIYNNSYQVDIYFMDGKHLSLIGFVDTGNNLYDPYKHRPIILVSQKYYYEDNPILVPYHTLSGNGLLPCSRIEKLYIDNTLSPSNVLVGFSDSPKLIDGIDVILHKDLMKG